MESHPSPLTVVGLLSGTSVDGLDAAVVRIEEQADTLVVQLLDYHEDPIDEALRRRVHALFSPRDSCIDEVCEVNVLLAEAFAQSAADAQRRAGVRADLVASHGQTVWHQVAPGHTRSTLQIGEPSVLAERLGVTVVAEFHPRDMAAGGEGAPLVSYPDVLLFSDEHLSRAVQNIGGIGNVTWVPSRESGEPPLAFDTGPGNMLIDHAVWRLSEGAQQYDRDGALGAQGTPDERPAGRPVGAAVFRCATSQNDRPRAVRRSVRRSVSGACAVARIARRRHHRDAYGIHRAIDRRPVPSLPARLPSQVVVGGGGARNPTLMRMLRAALAPANVVAHDDFGVPAVGREAIYFTVLGYQTLHGRPNTVPSCTAARHAVVLGKIVPGSNYLELVRRVASMPARTITRLRIEH